MAPIVMRLLLLLPFLGNGVNGADDWILAKRSFNIRYPCEDLVCFHLWQIATDTTNDYVGIISNGAIQTAQSEDEALKCTLPIRRLKEDSVGRDYCKRNPKAFIPLDTPSADPQMNLMPGKDMSLQCILLTDVEDMWCVTQQLDQVSLTWVDEDGVPIRENSQYQIKQQSNCSVTLTVTLQSPGNRKFKCQARVNDQIWTSVEFVITVPDIKRKGRGLVIELDPKPQGGNQDVIGAAVGVVGCVVLTTGAALYVVNKKRTNSRLSNESCYTSSANNVMDAGVVIYADINLPFCSDRDRFPECESTEYACVRYT